ncbi:MAG: GTPase Era [Alphaproteobacteria bacterium]
MTAPDENTKAGFASIIGLPNAGKSTLLNALVGSKISIVSRKVQTTRSRVLGIFIQDASQIILIDTPGIFTPKKTMEKAMVSVAIDSMAEADIVMHLVDASVRDTAEKNHELARQLPKDKDCVLLLNKIDAVKKEELLALTACLNEQYPYARTFMISALKNKGLDDLRSYLAQSMPAGPWLFPEDQLTDMPLRMLAAEITREKIFERLHQELPYAIFVETQGWENFDNGSIKIDQTVYVERDSQKGIVLGKGGRTVKEIGSAVRAELENMLETRVHLKIFVKAQPNWQERSENYRLMGLDFPA